MGVPPMRDASPAKDPTESSASVTVGHSSDHGKSSLPKPIHDRQQPDFGRLFAPKPEHQQDTGLPSLLIPIHHGPEQSNSPPSSQKPSHRGPQHDTGPSSLSKQSHRNPQPDAGAPATEDEGIDFSNPAGYMFRDRSIWEETFLPPRAQQVVAPFSTQYRVYQTISETMEVTQNILDDISSLPKHVQFRLKGNIAGFVANGADYAQRAEARNAVPYFITAAENLILKDAFTPSYEINARDFMRRVAANANGIEFTRLDASVAMAHMKAAGWIRYVGLIEYYHFRRFPTRGTTVPER